MQHISLKKTGAGTPVISGSDANFCTITDNGVGDYTINFVKKPFAQTPEVYVSLTAPGHFTVVAASNTAVQIKTWAVDGTTPAEKEFSFQAVASLARDLIG